MTSGGDSEITWTVSDEGSSSSVVVDHTRRPPLGLIALVAAVLVGVAVVATLRSGDAADVGEATATTTSTTRPTERPPAVTISSEVDLPDGAAAQLAGLAALGVPLELVVTSPTSDQARLVSTDGAEAVRVIELPNLTDLAFDASGRWIAGIDYTSFGEQRRILWAGRVDGRLEPIAVGLRSFAWHDEDPGRIAWGEWDAPRLTTLALAGHDDTEHVELPVPGLVRGWGDWGFALQSSPRSFSTSLVSPEGRVVVADRPGRFAAHVPGAGVIVSGSPGSPSVVDLDSGDSTEIAGLDAGEIVWSVTVTPDGPVAITIRTLSRVDGGGVRIVAIDDAEAVELAMASTITDLAAAPDGVVVIDQATADNGGRGTVTLHAAGRPLQVPVPDLFDGREWVTTLSSPNPIGAGAPAG